MSGASIPFPDYDFSKPFNSGEYQAYLKSLPSLKSTPSFLSGVNKFTVFP